MLYKDSQMTTSPVLPLLNFTTDAIPNNSDNLAGNLTEIPVSNTQIVVPVVFSLLVVIGSIGNGLVIYILLRYGEKSVTNVYIMNLAVADLLFIIIVLPVTAAYYAIPTWIFGDVVCRMSIYMVYVTLHATCLILAAMTIDRYHAIVNPIDSMNWRTPKVSLFISIGVWAISLSVSIPFLVYTSQVVDEGGNYQCSENWPPDISKIATLIVILSTYVLPLTVIVLCYARILHHLWRGMKHTRVPTSENEANGTVPLRSAAQLRRKRRVTRMVAAVILLFAIFWLPIHVINMWYKWDPNFPKSDVLLMFKIFSHTLSYANSCVNPFVYAFLNDGFRKAFRKRCPRLGKLFGCVKKAKSDGATSMIDKAVEARPGMEETHTEFTTQIRMRQNWRKKFKLPVKNIFKCSD